MPITYDGNYVEMNSASTRRPTPLVGAPGLVWRRAFWRPKNVGDQAWWLSVDDLLAKLFTRIRLSRDLCAPQYRRNPKNDLCPNFESRTGELHLFHHTYAYRMFNGVITDAKRPTVSTISDTQHLLHSDKFSITFDVFGARIVITGDLHHEYWVLTLIVDLSTYQHLPAAPGAKQSRSRSLNADLSGISAFLDSIHTIAIERSARRKTNSTGIGQKKPELDIQHDKILAEEKRELIENGKDFMEAIIDRKHLRFDATGRVFADAFGVIMGLHLSEKFTQKRPDKLIANEKQPKGSSITDRVSPQHLFGDERIHHVVDAIWPIVRHSQLDETSETLYGKPEYTVSTFQSCRILYISTLGRLADDVTMRRHKPAREAEPIIYFIVSGYQNRWQLGRIVDRINSLGTLRLAAIRDLRPLATASNSIRKIQADLANGVYDIKGDGKAVSAILLAKAFEEVGKAPVLDKNKQVVNDADGRPKLTDQSEIPEGIPYRVERSRYYAETFNAEILRLRVRRVEGFQSYDEFVARRLAGTFAFIARIGPRYTGLMDQVRLYDNIQRTASTAGLQQEIKDQTTKATIFLRKAEVVLVVPLTYYISSALHDLETTIRYWIGHFGSFFREPHIFGLVTFDPADRPAFIFVRSLLMNLAGVLGYWNIIIGFSMAVIIGQLLRRDVTVDKILVWARWKQAPSGGVVNAD